MNTIVSQFRQCAAMPRLHAKSFTILLTITFFILLNLANSVTEYEIPVLLLTFAVFLGSSFTWFISASVKKHTD